MAIDLELAHLHKQGIAITPSDVLEIETDVSRRQARFKALTAEAGIPDNLRALLEPTKKADVTKVATEATITEHQLFLLIHNCRDIGLKHRSRFPEYIPDHLVITDEDRSKLKHGEVRPVSKKLPSLLLERRHIHVHLFERRSTWHCFYFSYDDIEGLDKNHWAHGPHLHYVSHLWPNHTKDRIWSSFDKRRTEIPGSLHIRFVPFDFSDEAWPPPELLRGQLQSTVSLLFAPELAAYEGPRPTPSAQLATRGGWFVNVRVPRSETSSAP